MFAALGLAITFGLLGVINMAHGEMLMLGAYATYTVQTRCTAPAFIFWPPSRSPSWPPAVGTALERSIIRHLYRRPLETLLATWGISLGLIQPVRPYSGRRTSGREPRLAGGLEIAHGLVLPGRVGVVGFVVLVAAAVWFFLQRTGSGCRSAR